MIYLIILILLSIALWSAFSYNRFIKQKNMITEAWSGIDVQLKRRHDLIPNLVDSVKGYSTHEKELFQKITELRIKTMEAISPGEKSRTESGISGELRNLFAVAENYPDLKASGNFLNLQNQLAEIENQIQFAIRGQLVIFCGRELRFILQQLIFKCSFLIFCGAGIQFRQRGIVRRRRRRRRRRGMVE